MIRRFPKIVWLVTILISLTASAYAAEPHLSLSVDRTTVSVNDSLTVSVNIEGKAFISHPDLYGVEDFRVRSAGSSSQVQIINGRMSSSKVFHYILIPKRAGTFTIGPAVLNVSGRNYRSNTALVSITGERQVPQEERSAYMTANVSKTVAYAGEQIVYTAIFYTRIPFQNAELDVPEFTGFWKEKLGEVKNSQKVINGQLWQVSEIKFALFPLEPGEITIEKTALIGDFVVASRRPSSFFSNPLFESFHSTERKTFRSKAITLNVKPLPTEGKPANFSGLVGSFTMSQEITSLKLQAGESATLTIKVQGNGDLKKLPPPELNNAGDFKIYDDEPKVNITPTASGLKETKIFKKAIVPLTPGKHTLPPFKISFFDPKAGEYVSLSTDPIYLDVRPSSKPEQIIVSSEDGRGVLKKELEVLGEDLMPVVKGVSALESDILTERALLFYLVLSLLPIAAFIAVLVWYLRLQKVRADSGYIKRGKAYKRSQKEIKKLARVTGSDFYTQASLVIRDYIGDRLSMDGRSLTAADVSRRLEPVGASVGTCEQIVAFLNGCDAGFYGGRKFRKEEKSFMLNEITQLIKKLEKEFKK